ncbi:MAG TPA: hypothetical protein VGA37_12285 [Gemmatimonadales bacterium]
MKRAILAAVALALPACGDSSTAPSLSDLEGTWTMIEGVQSIVGDPASDFDLVDQGLGGTLSITSTGSFQLIIGASSGAPGFLVMTGSLTVDGANLQLTVGGATDAVPFTLQAGVLRLTIMDTDDVDNDGTDEDIRVVLAFERD